MSTLKLSTEGMILREAINLLIFQLLFCKKDNIYPISLMSMQ